MPTLPLPLGLTGLSSGDLPVVTDADVDAALETYLRAGESSVARNGIVAALFAILAKYQDRAEQARDQCDITRAAEAQLVAMAQEYGVFEAADEQQEHLRARVLAGDDAVTPTAILDAVNAILAPFTTIQACYAESIADRWFLTDGTAPWHSFVWDGTTSRDPTYFDRFYLDDAAGNGGEVVPGRHVGGARTFSTTGRTFFLRIPDLSVLDGNGAFIDDAGDYGAANANRWFLTNAVATGNDVLVSGVRSIPGTMTTIFEAIVSTVSRLKGQGIAFTVYADPNWVG